MGPRKRNHRRLVLFDIDGTLLLTAGAGLRAMARAAGELFGGTFVWEGVRPAGGLDPLLFAEAAQRSGLAHGPEEHAAFRELYVVYLGEELSRSPDRIRCMPGVREVLDRLRRHDAVVLGLLTGNYEPSADLKLQAAEYPREWFPVAVFGDEAGSRTALLRLAIDRYTELRQERLDPEQVVVVGDTPHDVKCALENGSRAFGVATGPFSVADLTEAGAHAVVEDLSAPEPLYEFLGIE